MVRVLSITSLALAAVSAVSGLVVPRLSPPSGWETDILEPYDQYHERYLALQCQDKHGQPFFDQCCHPLLATQKLESRPSQCIPDDCDDRSDNAATNVTPTPTYESPTPTPTPEPSSATSTPKPKASHTPDVNAGGQATFFYQNGVAGACGKVHSDDDLICALDERFYGDPGVRSAYCDQKVRITNTKNGKTVTVTVADDCPTCLNRNSIDLSEAAFKAIAPLSDGIASIEWSFV
ncbi:expansin family protein [Lactarius akahatsu]|uniref:Expansin family protein n=1 Tax=Lactarius akahatsu TaxID=416441 RepID=A0AAD4LQ99_9AGAM|nr:expansin family protein [Lactarius akahatsu]